MQKLNEAESVIRGNRLDKEDFELARDKLFKIAKTLQITLNPKSLRTTHENKLEVSSKVHRLPVDEGSSS